MYRQLLSFAMLAAMLSCSKTEKSNSETSIVEAAGAVQKVGSSLDAVNKRAAELKTMAPVANDALKAVLPETLNGLPRTEVTVGNNPMVISATGSAVYGTQEKNIELSIVDCAGEAGSGLYTLAQMGLVNDQEKTEADATEKTSTIDGRRVSIKERKSADVTSSEVIFIEKERYIVTLKGEGYSSADLLAAAKNLDFSALK